jgi:hypothetical protein
MFETIDKLAIKLCENLPLNVTIYEKDGLCEKPYKNCSYCKPIYNINKYICYKKTYTLKKTIS